MKKSQIENLIKKEKQNFVPDISDRIAPIKNIPIEVPVTTTSRRNNRLRTVAVACCMVLICLTIALTPAFAQEYDLYIDVNPSLMLSINGYGMVTSVNQLNSDAMIFDEQQLLGKNIDKAMDIIIEQFDSNGYFVDNSELVLSISNSKRQAQVTKLQARIDKKLAKHNINATTSQNIITQNELELIKSNQASAGQLKYIREISNALPTIDTTKLYGKTMNEIKLIKQYLINADLSPEELDTIMSDISKCEKGQLKDYLKDTFDKNIHKDDNKNNDNGQNGKGK